MPVSEDPFEGIVRQVAEASSRGRGARTRFGSFRRRYRTPERPEPEPTEPPLIVPPSMVESFESMGYRLWPRRTP